MSSRAPYQSSERPTVRRNRPAWANDRVVPPRAARAAVKATP
jgi:hypothetical protein